MDRLKETADGNFYKAERQEQKMNMAQALKLSKYNNAQQYTGDPEDFSARARIRSNLSREFKSAQPKPGIKPRQSPKTNFANGLLADIGFNFRQGEVPSIRDVSDSQIKRIMERANRQFENLTDRYATQQQSKQQNYSEMGSLGLLSPGLQQEYDASARALPVAEAVAPPEASQGIASLMRPSVNVTPYSSQIQRPVEYSPQIQRPVEYSPFYNAMASYNEPLYGPNTQLQNYAALSQTPFAFDYSGYYPTGGER